MLGYPLNKKHYGSGEQAIIEAMYSKIPVVAFSNHAEKEIIKNKNTGILVNNKNDYVKAIKKLYSDPIKRRRIGNNANKHILENLSPTVCFKDLEKIYKDLMSLKKKHRKYKNSKLKKTNIKNYGAQLFIESLDESGEEFFNSFKNFGKKIDIKSNEKIKNSEIELKVPTKGSLFQYLYFYPKDPYLNFWAGLMSLKDKNVLKRKHKSLPKTTKDCFKIALNYQPRNKEFKYYLNKIK